MRVQHTAGFLWLVCSLTTQHTKPARTVDLHPSMFFSFFGLLEGRAAGRRGQGRASQVPASGAWHLHLASRSPARPVFSFPLPIHAQLYG